MWSLELKSVDKPVLMPPDTLLWESKKKTQREARRVTDAMNNPTAKQGHSLPLQTVKLMGKLPTQY